MKKHLLLGSALVAAISAFPQVASLKQRQTPLANMTERMAQKFAIQNNMEARSEVKLTSGQVISPVQEPATNITTGSKSASIPPVTWNAFTGSMNMYGVLVSSSKPLQYDDELNAITFVHRKSQTYAATPNPTSVGATTGVLVAMVSQNWGSSWDSTMIYNDNNNWARYPQGGILKGVGSTNISNAYIVATAPITQANASLGWIGDIITTKQLGTGTYNNIQAQSSQTFMANTPPYAGPWVGNYKMDFLRHDFTATDDGKVRALGQIFGGNANTPATQDFRGARMVIGSFNAGQLIFTTDSFIPPVRPNPLAPGERFLAATQGMAWSEDGDVGYVYFVGAHTSAVGSTVAANVGYQPIIAKTIDKGLNWTWQSIDFNQPQFVAPVMDHLVSTDGNPNLAVPFFNYWEGMTAVVDSLDRLHLISMMVHSPAAADPDSVNYYTRFNNYDGEVYFYAHQPGLRPYIYDFTGGLTGWQVTVIDSMPTEGPGTRPADNGYSSNQWLPDADGNKIDIDGRIQASRTPDGSHIIYTWSETDTVTTTNTNGYTKWNQFPNVKARLMEARTLCVSKTEINITKLPGTNGTNPNVANRAYNHYISPKMRYDATAATTNSIVFNLPITVSSNAALDPSTPATHRYTSAPLEFARPCFTPVTPTTGVGYVELTDGAAGSVIFPNPANNSAFLGIELKNSTDVKITVLNMVGQVVKESTTACQIGSNNIEFDLSGLAKGVYMVNVTTADAVSTKKLLVE